MANGDGRGERREGRLVAEPQARGARFREASPSAEPACPYLDGPPAEAPAGVEGRHGLDLGRCDDKCQRWSRHPPRPADVAAAYKRNELPPRPPAFPSRVAPTQADALPPSRGAARPLSPTVGAPHHDAPDGPASPAVPPPGVPPPRGLAGWSSEPTAPDLRRFGSHSHGGPSAASDDKGNQDFAFHRELTAPDRSVWVLVGVADGVSQATWSSRGAQHVSASFVEAVDELLHHPDAPLDSARLGGDRWPQIFAQAYHGRVLDRLSADRDRLLAGRFVDPTWEARPYDLAFLDGPNASREVRKKWFQSTLLAVALGPYGGFGLFLGDGFVRVDRYARSVGWQSSSGLEPSAPVSFGIQESAVFAGIERLSPKGAERLGVLVTTDGVSKSPSRGIALAMQRIGTLPGPEAKDPLEQLAPASSDECAVFLNQLAALPPGMVDVDNMSLAFASRTLEAPRSP